MKLLSGRRVSRRDVAGSVPKGDLTRRPRSLSLGHHCDTDAAGQCLLSARKLGVRQSAALPRKRHSPGGHRRDDRICSKAGASAGRITAMSRCQRRSSPATAVRHSCNGTRVSFCGAESAGRPRRVLSVHCAAAQATNGPRTSAAMPGDAAARSIPGRALASSRLDSPRQGSSIRLTPPISNAMRVTRASPSGPGSGSTVDSTNHLHGKNPWPPVRRTMAVLGEEPMAIDS